jgi:hypothetical protein
MLKAPAQRPSRGPAALALGRGSRRVPLPQYSTSVEALAHRVPCVSLADDGAASFALRAIGVGCAWAVARAGAAAPLAGCAVDVAFVPTAVGVPRRPFLLLRFRGR